jgi:voltage-gated potassium channel Kch
MNTLVYLFVASGLAIIIGTFLMYNLESRAENTQMKTLLDALWWCIATVTTVGYGDVVPVTSLGRIMAIIYMFFGITLIAVLLAVISNNFYRKRIDKQESEKKEQETNYLRNLIMKRLSDIELKQSECIELVNQLSSSMENNNNNKNKSY